MHEAGPRKREAVRERIITASLEILREGGIQELSQVQVSRRAGVRQSHLTYYFPRRHDLLDAVAARFINGLAQGLAGIAGTAGGDAATVVRQVAEAITEPGHMRMFAGVVAEADRDPELRAMMVRETLRLQELLAGLLGGDQAAERAGFVLSSLLGIGLYGLIMHSGTDPLVRRVAAASAPAAR